MKVGVLALQGAFREHMAMLSSLGVNGKEVRITEDIDETDALIIPGGESTVMEKLLKKSGLDIRLRERIQSGMPVMGTCAGLIILAKNHILGEMKIKVKRNGYGRQLGSFKTYGDFGDIEEFPMIFIRAPYIEEVGDGVTILAKVDEKIVAAQEGNIMVVSFHPELTEDGRIHQYFINNI